MNECIKASHYREAAKYIPKCDAKMRADLYFRVGALKDAALSAFNVKDVDTLTAIRSKVSDPTLAEEVDSLISRLTK